MKQLLTGIGIYILSLCASSAHADVLWFDGSRPVSYQVEGKTAPVVGIALDMFASDMEMVTGQRAVSTKDATIHIYELDKNPSAAGKLKRLGVPVGELLQKIDAFYICVVPQQQTSATSQRTSATSQRTSATPRQEILIVGANGRGCAYGILEMSRMAGVSPWVWWGDVVPGRREHLAISDSFTSLQAPSVTYRGIFINDEDWSLRNWSKTNFEPARQMGPATYKEIFKLLLRLRANTVWPAMHEGTPGFFTVEGNKAMADSCGILIGTSHCEPLLRNNVAEWNVNERGPYNYITNRDEVQRYWAERLKEVRGSEELFTIGMRGIHDGSMEGVKTREEKLNGLQQVIDDQRKLIRKYYDKNVERVPQVFIPYKEVLEIMESGLHVPDDVTLMWCDDNYGYMTRLSDGDQQKRKGGGGVYYHLSYWGRPHDHLWLTATQPGLIYTEMKAAYDHNARKLWIVNVHDPKVAAYDLELFMDMAWNINSVTPNPSPKERGVVTIEQHLERWLCTQYGETVGKLLFPAMKEFYRLCGIRKPEFMGWTQVELDKKKVPGGKSLITDVEMTRQEAACRLEAFGQLKATVDKCRLLVRPELADAYFAHVVYPVYASAAMTRKIVSDTAESHHAYEEIQRLTEQYNNLGGGKWNGLMDAAPRQLPVFADANGRLQEETADLEGIAVNACDYSEATGGAQTIQMLGHSMNAVSLPKGGELIYDFDTDREGEATLYTAMIPTQPNDKGDLRYSVSIDGNEPVVISLKTPYRSEAWKKSVMRGQALKETKVKVGGGKHRLVIKALDDHIIADQWMLDFKQGRKFYVIPVGKVCQKGAKKNDR